MNDSLLTTEQAAKFLISKSSTLESWRTKNMGPPFVKIGPRMVRYRLSDLNNWITENLKTNDGIDHTNQSHE